MTRRGSAASASSVEWKRGGDTHRLGRTAELTDVGTGSEDALAPGDDDGAGQVGLEFGHDRSEAGEQLLGQRVDLGIVQCDDSDVVVAAFEQDQFVVSTHTSTIHAARNTDSVSASQPFAPRLQLLARKSR